MYFLFIIDHVCVHLKFKCVAQWDILCKWCAIVCIVFMSFSCIYVPVRASEKEEKPGVLMEFAL